MYKDADTTGSEWVAHNAAGTKHKARALLCDIGLSDLADSIAEAQITSSIEDARMCTAQPR